ncbi:ribonuclease YeeF family protein [Metabacillus litoralis]|uniref:ribonuclease YeeF family protein n=1 Tax=Metabacillus litoralis TaxID=152268 RepID=UPI001CFF0A04|nr:T7SS effector LXG polymorphic toxin [Metabacillus litoralis]
MRAVKVFEAKPLIESMEDRSQNYDDLREKLQHLKKKFTDIVQLDDALQGKGAAAIKGFYQGQIDVVEAWLRLIDRNIAFFNGISGMTEDVDLSGNTTVYLPFLEDELSHHETSYIAMVTSQQEELQTIVNQIDDLVPLNVFSMDRFNDQLAQAQKKRRSTIQAVESLDADLKTEYMLSENDEYYAVTLFQQLIEATRQGGNTISPIHFNAEAYKSSDVYKLKEQAEQQAIEYLSYKEEQEKMREQLRELEELERRPWYEKAADTVRTFTGELTGYYDYIRASEGVDPVTGEELTEGQRVAAGAMAAAGFIPVVGWAGRIFKGGSAIYKTTKGVKAADQALDVYRNSKTFSNLEKAEMGIYGLVSANGFSEYLTGKDMFGNKLTVEQQENSLYQALGLLAVGGGAYYVNRLQAENGIYQIPGKNDGKVTPYEARNSSVNIHRMNVNRSEYLHGKFGKLSKEELHNRINNSNLRRMLKDYSPSDVAQNWQGSSPYFGVDEYVDKLYTKGTILYAGEPFPSGYFSTKEAIMGSGKDATKLFKGVQVKPFYQKGMSNAIYRDTMGAYQLNIDLIGANGLAKANPQFGEGGLEQIFMADFNELIHNKFITRIKDGEIKLSNNTISIEEYKEIEQKIRSYE